MLTHKEQRVIEELLQGSPIRKGQEWFVRTHIAKATDYGWGHFAQRGLITTWGGTTDAIRGLLACGMSPEDPLITHSVEWLVQQKRDDGSFPKRANSWPCVESTAWTLLLLRQLNYDTNSKVFQDACQFLENCVRLGGGLATSDSKQDEVRIYPSILTLWALHGLSKKEFEIVEFIKKSIDVKTGGWGPKPLTAGKTAITAQVLYVMLSTGHLKKDDEMSTHASDFILSEINAQGVWDNFSENWYSYYQSELNHCEHCTTPWALLSLLEGGIRPLDRRIIHAFTWLVTNQLSNGGWSLSDTDQNEYTWHVANCLVCLNHMRSSIIGPLVDAAVTSKAIINTDYRNLRQHPFSYLHQLVTRENINSFLILIILIILFHEYVNTIIHNVLLYFEVQQNGILSNLLSSFIWVLIVAIGTFIMAKLRRS